MAPALWLIGLPLGAATVVYLLRRLWAGAVVAALATLLLAWLSVQIPTGVVLNVLGRTVELDRLSQVTLFLIFAATAVLFLTLTFATLARQRETRPTAASPQTVGEGRIFYPAALLILGLFVAASLSRHLGITAIFVELAAILMVFVIQTERLESTRAALRFLILISLATPLFLLAARVIDNYQLSGGVVSATTIEQTALLIGLGFAMWLAAIPFHGWLTSIAAESSASTATFVLITFPSVALLALIKLLIDLPWLVDSAFLVNGIILAGVFTAFTAGLLSAIQRGFSELMGYAALFDLGCILALLGVGGPAALLAILTSMAVRTVALLLMAVSLTTIDVRGASAGFMQMKGAAYQMPLASFGLIIGGLTLAGAPLLAGFAPFWQLIRTIAELDPRGALLLSLGGVGVALGYLRGLRAILAAPPARTRTGQLSLSPQNVSKVQFLEPLPLAISVGILSGLCLLLGLFPSLLIDLLEPFVAFTVFPVR